MLHTPYLSSCHYTKLAAEEISELVGSLDLLLNCSAVLHGPDGMAPGGAREEGGRDPRFGQVGSPPCRGNRARSPTWGLSYLGRSTGAPTRIPAGRGAGMWYDRYPRAGRPQIRTPRDPALVRLMTPPRTVTFTLRTPSEAEGEVPRHVAHAKPACARSKPAVAPLRVSPFLPRPFCQRPASPASEVTTWPSPSPPTP